MLPYGELTPSHWCSVSTRTVKTYAQRAHSPRGARKSLFADAGTPGTGGSQHEHLVKARVERARSRRQEAQLAAEEAAEDATADEDSDVDDDRASATADANFRIRIPDSESNTNGVRISKNREKSKNIMLPCT